MAEYHVGCGAFGIYAGTLNNKNKTLWQNKSNVTNEAILAVAEYLLKNKIGLRFTYEDAEYELRVVPEPPKEGDSE